MGMHFFLSCHLIAIRSFLTGPSRYHSILGEKKKQAYTLLLILSPSLHFRPLLKYEAFPPPTAYSGPTKYGGWFYLYLTPPPPPPPPLPPSRYCTVVRICVLFPSRVCYSVVYQVVCTVVLYIILDSCYLWDSITKYSLWHFRLPL